MNTKMSYVPPPIPEFIPMPNYESHQDSNQRVRGDSDYELSDGEEADDQYYSDPKNWRSYVLVFGKHKGKNLDTMIRRSKTRRYLRYILRWDLLRKNTGENIKAALEHHQYVTQDAPRSMMPPPLIRRNADKFP